MEKGCSLVIFIVIGDCLYVGIELWNWGGFDDGGGFLFLICFGGFGDILLCLGVINGEYVVWKMVGINI